MKVILSRKGFDSSFGGVPSPILPDERIISFPIPSKKDFIKYSDLQLESNKTYYDLMQELNITKIKEKYICHLDPDISRDIYPRLSNWKGAFGQIDAAQGHLENQSISVGDLFLFFGWFRHTKYDDSKGKLVYYGPSIHMIFGYLQIGEILKTVDETIVPEWLKQHPHCSSDRVRNHSNTIYISTDNLSFNDNLSGCGNLQYNDNLVLTKKGYSRSKWELPDFFKDLQISYHTQNSWKSDYFDSAKIGQEFVIEENSKVEEWVHNLINNN